MTDPTQAAIERARSQGPYMPDPTGSFPANHYDADQGIPAIRVPSGRRTSRMQAGDTYLPYVDQNATLGDLSQVQTAHLDETEKQALLDRLLSGHNTHTEKTRDLEHERDKVDLENKRRFSTLGFRLAAAFGIAVIVGILTLLGMLVYGYINDKPMIDGGLFGSFLNTFVEMFKVLATLF